MTARKPRVFGVGWARTGTTTLGRCLTELGYRHQGQRLDLMPDVMAGRLTRVFSLAADRESFEDWPWILLYREMDTEFPGSRFVLTVRDTDRWLASYRNMLERLPAPSPQLLEIRRFLYGESYPDIPDTDLRARFEAHNQAVRDYFNGRAEVLLVVDWERGDGWTELCSFLDLPVPETAFPHEHRTR